MSTGSVQLSITDTLLNVTARGSTTPSAISITNATASISTTTGALAVTGGVGIGGDLNVGGITTASNMDITSASPSIFSTPTGTVTLGKNAGQMTIAQIAATIDIGGSIIGTQTVSLANSGNASLVNVNIAASVGNGNTRTIAIGANGSGATTVNLYLGSNSTASKTYINTTTAVSASTFSVNGSAGISGSVYAGGPVLINQTSTTTNIGYLTNNQTTAVLSVGDPAGTLTLTKQWAMSTATSTTNNATVDTFRWLDAGGNVIGTSGISGHIYVYSRGASGGANALNAVYTIVSGGNGTTDAVLTSVASHGRGTSPVSSIQVANDGAGGGIKITTTYINNTGVVTGGVTVMSFVGLLV